eukprot:1106365-Pleurochrysis_carterae.AAC.1
MESALAGGVNGTSSGSRRGCGVYGLSAPCCCTAALLLYLRTCIDFSWFVTANYYARFLICLERLTKGKLFGVHQSLLLVSISLLPAGRPPQ